jgi:hypothetical protein
VVENSGKTLCPGALKPVNLPEPLKVEEDSTGRPLNVKMPRKQIIKTIEDCWRIDDEWWRSEPVSRLYYAVMLASGQRLIIYKDLILNSWYRQMY